MNPLDIVVGYKPTWRFWDRSWNCIAVACYGDVLFTVDSVGVTFTSISKFFPALEHFKIYRFHKRMSQECLRLAFLWCDQRLDKKIPPGVFVACLFDSIGHRLLPEKHLSEFTIEDCVKDKRLKRCDESMELSGIGLQVGPKQRSQIYGDGT